MKSKLISTSIFLFLFYGLPLAGRPDLLLTNKVLVLLIGCLLVFLTQPAIDPQDARAQQGTDRHSVWLILGLSGLSIAAPLIEWAYWHPDLSWRPTVWIGFCILLSGISLRFWAIRTLGRHFTATVQVSAQQPLITHGPYAWVRHPSYLGAYLAFLGSAVVLEAWFGLLLAALAMGLVYRVRIQAEEETLERAFGQAYRSYRFQTWKMLPGLW